MYSPLDQDMNGRHLRAMFMGLPSKKDYPDYYQVIMEPIDMTMIDAKIKADKVSAWVLAKCQHFSCIGIN
jgi:protein polybromo-1